MEAPAAKPTRDAFATSIHEYLALVAVKDWGGAEPSERLNAVSVALRRTIAQRLVETERRYADRGAKRLYYLSMEFLMGRSLANNLGNLGVTSEVSREVRALGDDLARLEELEQDAALGNGGLGRLAACFLDSLATLGMPGFGYGINYEFGLFRQSIDDGFQSEQPDQWFADRCPWLIERPAEAVMVPVYGRVEAGVDRQGEHNPMWLEWRHLIGVPAEMPIVGFGGRTVNTLRLFSARSSDQFDMAIFNGGDYLRAVEQKIASETVSKVLYPSNAVAPGRELRLVQEYFLVACAMRDIVRRYKKSGGEMSTFAAKVAIQLNDTHPALMVAELMRLLVDEEGLRWETAWDITVATLGYTNHTLLPEALERWSVDLLRHVLPRHLELIFEINRRFLDHLEVNGIASGEGLAPYSVIEEGPTPQVRMAHLAIIGSHSVNGVAALHTKLLQERVVPQFAALWPERFNNKTNGVTPRRWLLHCNPALAALLTELVGEGWPTELEQLRRLETHADATDVLSRLAVIKRANKERLATLAYDTTGLRIDPASLFDVQIKRIHEYKRQLLNVLHIIHRYVAIINGGETPLVPRTFIFAGKAAPGYFMAKRIIKLITSVGDLVNRDPRSREWLRVVFLPDYRVTLAERIVPAADLSEQISTAGKEASGTGNMKLGLNGALTVGTLDGANVEMLEEVGADNIFIFGLSAAKVAQTLEHYQPLTVVDNDVRVGEVIRFLQSAALPDSKLFAPLVDKLLSPFDEYVHLADLPAFIDIQGHIDQEYLRPAGWQRKALLNIARLGKFSSDRTVQEYATDVWGISVIA
ncbi:MAG TPA: glycogen/starch/alpha-glucan phosphorylase [Vicinamibacterales bacterium]|nr:glycogen/starch/alpha-glucan phosphorylase [Vicinamibacterales bacterium]